MARTSAAIASSSDAAGGSERTKRSVSRTLPIRSETAASTPRAPNASSVEPPPFLVVDVGGGSTELAFGARGVEAAVSLRIGSVRLTERFVRSDPPAASELDAIAAEVRAMLGEAAGVVRPDAAKTLIAVAGTATTMQGMALDLGSWDPEATHRTWLSLERARGVVGLLASMTTTQRAAVPVMPLGRADVMPAGAVILVEVMTWARADRALVSETDILDGLAFEALGTR